MTRLRWSVKSFILTLASAGIAGSVRFLAISIAAGTATAAAAMAAACVAASLKRPAARLDDSAGCSGSSAARPPT
jgi:hypothetical protein